MSEVAYNDLYIVDNNSTELTETNWVMREIDEVFEF